MWNKNPTALQKYVVAIGMVLVAFGLRYGIYGTLDHRLPFTFFTMATVISAWYGGLGPGMLAALAVGIAGGRMLDVSKKAARKQGMVDAGVASVEISYKRKKK